MIAPEENARSVKLETAETPNVTLHVRQLDLKHGGFFPRYRMLLAAKQAFTDPQKATPEDADAALKLLSTHVVEPKDKALVLRVLQEISAEELMQVFTAVVGTDRASPPDPSGEKSPGS